MIRRTLRRLGEAIRFRLLYSKADRRTWGTWGAKRRPRR